MTRTIFFAALGCPKNRVDTERMVGLAQNHGYQLAADPSVAQVIVVNTCAFIEAARVESIDAILELAEHKKTGNCKLLVVAGCLPQRHVAELVDELPEVDHFIGTVDLPSLDEILGNATVARSTVSPPEGLVEARYERVLVDAPHSAYLKIAEGCDRHCAFCAIPAIRGKQRSRSIASLLDEASSLVEQGVRELILVAQDTTAYGHDLDAVDRPSLTTLLDALDGIDALRWIRVLYAYPTLVTDELVATMAAREKVVPYLDLPIQHVDDRLLRLMRRGYGGQQLQQTIERLRTAIPQIALRATVICGHPGETADAHEALLRFVEQTRFDHLGAFAFSAEQGTHSATLPDSVPAELATERSEQVMQLQQRISAEKLRGFVGRTIEVLVDGPSDESDYLLQGRHAGQAPEIDGIVLLTDGTANAGDLVRAKVTDSGDYDLVASLA